MDNNSLMHYGVKGMKWGVWNADTRAKYSGGKSRKSTTGSRVTTAMSKHAAKTLKAAGRAVGRGAKAVGSVLKRGGSAAANKVTASIKQRRTEKQLAKEQGIRGRKLKQFKEVRKTTLRSHDPAVIAKGMHTLSDEELDKKISRLKQEQQVNDMVKKRRDDAADTAKRREEVRKARKERRNTGFVAQVARDTATSTLKVAGSRLVTQVLGEEPLKAAKNRTESAKASAAEASAAKARAEADKARAEADATRTAADYMKSALSGTVSENQNAASRGEAIIGEIIKVEDIPRRR